MVLGGRVFSDSSVWRLGVSGVQEFCQASTFRALGLLLLVLVVFSHFSHAVQ